MQPSLSVPSILTLMGIAQALLLAVAALSLRRGYVPAHRSLAVFFVLVSITLCGNFLSHSRYVLGFPHLAQVHVPFQFLVGPIFFFYIKAVLQRQSTRAREIILHSVPFGACLLYLIPFYVRSGEHKILYLTAAFQNYPADWRIRTAFAFAQEFIYLVLSFLLIVTHSRKNHDSAASIPPTDIRWTRFLVAVFGTLWAVGVVRYLFAHRVETILLVPSLASAFVFLASYKGLRRSPMLEGVVEEASTRKYEKSSLRSDASEKHLRRLLQVMETEKPYMDADLTLQKLAQRLAILPQHLSQVVNERLRQSFVDFINSYRVEAAKKGLTDPNREHYSIVAIAAESGFNSKSAFNATFKKHVRMTPTQFRRLAASKAR